MECFSRKIKSTANHFRHPCLFFRERCSAERTPLRSATGEPAPLERHTLHALLLDAAQDEVPMPLTEKVRDPTLGGPSKRR